MANIDDKYIKIQGWMVNQLELTGSELMIYARIYSFQFQELNANRISREAKPVEIPMRDFVYWTRLDKSSVARVIQRLIAKGYVHAYGNAGHISSYSINMNELKKAVKKSEMECCTSATVAPETPLAPTQHTPCTDTTLPPAPVQHSVASMQQTPCTSATHRQPTTKTTKKTTKTTTRTRVQDDASASLSSTDTEDRYEDLSKTEIVFFEKQALKKLNETDKTTGQKLYLTKDPRDQFPKAFLFMTAKDTSQFTDTEFELFKLVSMYTAFGPAKPLPTVSEEDIKYVPQASEIGQEAHDAQQALVDWLFEGGPSPSSYAHDAPLQSRRQK